MNLKNLIPALAILTLSCNSNSKTNQFAANVSNTDAIETTQVAELVNLSDIAEPTDLKNVNELENPKAINQKIQVALLLDTSGSMNGLIEQAKSRLWNIVNTLTTLKYEGQSPEIEISLYEYGNDNISSRADWVRQIVPLSKDLDEISAKLFALTTNGGEEYCGSVINHATKNLKWEDSSKILKLVYIAGNEPFNQQGINYKEAIKEAQNNNIYINTIFCGNYDEGVRTFWQDGATLGNGKYFNIDANQKVRHIDTPYDDEIAKYNLKMNDTYYNYSVQGSVYKEKQVKQDQLSETISKANAIERSVSKIKEKVYDNSHWDLVDNYKKDKDFVKKIKKSELPEELKNKSELEIKAFADKKLKEREIIQSDIEKLAKKRQEYIDQKSKASSEKADDLGKSIEKSILEIGKRKGYKQEN
jgi:von Willebrand factor type A domain